MSNGTLHHEEITHKRGLFARIIGGLIVLVLLNLFWSLIQTHLVNPALSFWEPHFVKALGTMEGDIFGFLPKLWFFWLFSFTATVCTAYMIEMLINSRAFSIQGLLFRKIPVLKHIVSFAQGSAAAYRNLKRARSAYLRVVTQNGEFFIPAFLTREIVLYRSGVPILCFVVYCPHTPTFLTGNTFVIPKKYVREGGIIDAPTQLLIETVVGAGIFGKNEEIKEEFEQSQS